MNIFDNMIITKIENVLTVHSEKGRKFEMKNRLCYGLTFAYSGKIIYYHNNKKYTSKKDVAVIIPKGASYYLEGAETGDFPIINFHCENLNVNSFIEIPIKNCDEHFNNYERLKKTFLLKNNFLKAMSILYEMLFNLSNEDKTNNLMINLIEENYQNSELSNLFLAEKLGISEVYFRKRFSKLYNISPRQYILEVRIRHAKLLLLESKNSITEISEKCGFSSVFHFCRAFKTIVGKSPTQYRNELKTITI